MSDYKDKIKAIIVIVTVAILLATAVCLCMWDDTSLNSLIATGGTANYNGRVIALGDRLTIDDIKYTVGYRGTVDNESFVTLFSDDVSGKGVPLVYDKSGKNYNYDGRSSSAPDPNGTVSQIFTSINNYYTTLEDKTVTLDRASFTFGKVSELIIPHLDYGWSLWLPSVRELNLYNAGGYNDTYYDVNLIEGLRQPAMYYYDSNERRIEQEHSDYWLRTPFTGSPAVAFYVNSSGILYNEGVNYPWSTVRVALNLRI